MFRPLEPRREEPSVPITVNGRHHLVRAGVPLAIALLEAGITPTRHTPVSGQPRAPYCLMGVCFECVVQIDGQANVPSCMVATRAGMAVELQSGARRVESAT
jgi:predicted molibdopterin-dependent oxidoreductase YjgC